MMNKIKKILVLLVLFASIVALTGCGKKKDEAPKNPILGSWKYDGAEFTYTFNEDGTGSYNAMGNNMEFTYTTDGDKISILYTGNTVPFETTFEINDDTLNVKDSFGADVFYKKVN